MPYWEYLAAHPDQQALFDQAMVQRAQVLSLACVPVLDWPRSGTIAHIAGGACSLPCSRPPQVPTASWSTSPRCWSVPGPSWTARGWPTAVRCTLGTCSPPHSPAELYLLASVLHDWEDTHAAGILAAVGGGATKDTRLRIFEMVLPEDATPHRAKMSDVLMMLMFDGARERTVGQYRERLDGTGWQLEQVAPSPGPMSVIEASRSATS